jgi:hypothetical protein
MLKKPEVLTEERVWSDLQAAAFGAGVIRRTKQGGPAGEEKLLNLPCPPCEKVRYGTFDFAQGGF